MNNKPSYRSEVLGNELRITIPTPKKLFTTIFLSVWLAFWSIIGGAFALRAIVGIVGGEVDIFLSLWAIFWALGEIEGMYHLLWQLVGKEEIEVAPDSIVIHHAILGIGQSKVYASKNISYLRVDPTGREEPYAPNSEGISLSRGTGMIAFDYMGKTIRIGIGVNQSEAKELVAEIQRQYPQFKK